MGKLVITPPQHSNHIIAYFSQSEKMGDGTRAGDLVPVLFLHFFSFTGKGFSRLKVVLYFFLPLRRASAYRFFLFVLHFVTDLHVQLLCCCDTKKPSEKQCYDEIC